MERFLVLKDSYIDIKKEDVDGKTYITVTVEPKYEYKDGDMLRTKFDSIFIFKDDKTIEQVTSYFFMGCGDFVAYDDIYPACDMCDIDGYCTPEEVKLIHERLKKDGKRWNADKKCIEDIPQHKFKSGDKVRIKDGISSKTHNDIGPCFGSDMDQFLGKMLIVKGYTIKYGYVECEDNLCHFSEDWLEPFVEEVKVGDTVIAWDAFVLKKDTAVIGTVDLIGNDGKSFYISGIWYYNAVKWDGTREQFEKVRRGEL